MSRRTPSSLVSFFSPQLLTGIITVSNSSLCYKYEDLIICLWRPFTSFTLHVTLYLLCQCTIFCWDLPSFLWLCYWSISYIADAFLTEKYFGPVDNNNKTGGLRYDQPSLITRVESFPSRSLYLVHTPGDWIHLDQSMILSRALVENGILFKQQVFNFSLLKSPTRGEIQH